MPEKPANRFNMAASFVWQEGKYVAKLYFAPLTMSFWRNPVKFFEQNTRPRP